MWEHGRSPARGVCAIIPLSRQFALEYSALFDALLPALQHLGLPIPLGGTSNHLRISALRDVGGWDPFNVTEDADLGIRLARKGFAVQTLHSTTWEESPPDFGNWHRQRTRWLKGWMQTFEITEHMPIEPIFKLTQCTLHHPCDPKRGSM